MHAGINSNIENAIQMKLFYKLRWQHFPTIHFKTKWTHYSLISKKLTLPTLYGFYVKTPFCLSNIFRQQTEQNAPKHPTESAKV